MKLHPTKTFAQLLQAAIARDDAQDTREWDALIARGLAGSSNEAVALADRQGQRYKATVQRYRPWTA